ncbi:hypothetical protein Aperf_G00000098084 [Anoplocephala perfoliata]
MESDRENQANPTVPQRVSSTTKANLIHGGGMVGIYGFIAAFFALLLITSFIRLCRNCIYEAEAAHDDERGVEEGPNITGSENEGNIGSNEDRWMGVPSRNREEEGRRQRTPSPPMDFRLPDEMPKLPDYDEACKSEGLPPDYDAIDTEPPEYAPPPVIKKGENHL